MGSARPRLLLLALLAPAALILGLLTLYPLARLFLLSFAITDHGFDGARFAGLENYAELVASRSFRTAAGNTVWFTIIATVSEVLVGLGLALLLDRTFPGRRAITLALVAPFVLSTVVVSAVWRAWFHYEIGFLNVSLRALGLPGMPWLFDPDVALGAIVLVDLWQNAPFCFLILFAGLRAIPPEVNEAARIDGAGPWRRFRDVTLPLLAPYLLIAALMRSIDSFKLFDKVYAMTGGGPGNATETLSMHVHRLAFRFFDIGMASAAAVVMVVIAACLGGLYARALLRVEAR
jgi:multiple sugar transport system permease protein